MGRVGSREIVLLKSRNDLFVKLSLHQELPKYFTSLDPKFINHIDSVHNSLVPSSTLNLWNRAHSLSLLDTTILHLSTESNMSE